MSTPAPAETEARHGAPGVGAGVSLLVLLTISMQIVLGGEGAWTTLRGEQARDCVRRLPTAVVRVIRDLTERRDTVASERAVTAWAAAERVEPVLVEREVAAPAMAMGEWLLDLPPPATA